MDDSSSGMDLNLDPDMMTTQGGTPQSTVPSPATPVASITPDNSIIDITPGAATQPTLVAPVTHIDQAVTPAPRVLDITPVATAPSAPIQPETPVVVETPAVTETPVITPVENITPAQQITAPASPQTVAAPTATPQYVSPQQVTVNVAAPVQPPVTAPNSIVPPAPQPKNTAGLNIDTSSPLYEDPDKVVLAK